MTVAELIKALQAIEDQDRPVEIWHPEVEDWMVLDEVQVDEPYTNAVRLRP